MGEAASYRYRIVMLSDMNFIANGREYLARP